MVPMTKDHRPRRLQYPCGDHARGDGDGERNGIEPEQQAVAALDEMRAEERGDGGNADHREIGRVGDPEHRIAPEDQVADGAAADAGQRGHEDETDDVELRAAGRERAGQREDEDGGEIEKLGEGHRGACLIPWCRGRA